MIVVEYKSIKVIKSLSVSAETSNPIWWQILYYFSEKYDLPEERLKEPDIMQNKQEKSTTT